jgi:DNA-directed RNA polymerase subunit RPC12/RpoP
MATKILSPGTDRYSATCHECGCRFTYERSDVHRNYAQGGERVSCPHCGHSMHHFGASGTVWPRSS